MAKTNKKNTRKKNTKKEENFVDPFSDAPAQTATPEPDVNPFDDSDSNPFA